MHLYSNKRSIIQTVVLFLTLTFGLLLLPALSFGAVLFEGYYKVYLGADHIGYYVQKYESVPAKKQMKTQYLIYTNVGGETTTEGLAATSDENFVPLDYQYTALVKGKTKTIDATFAGGKMKGKITEAGKVTPISATVPQDGFLSIFLNYVLLKNGLSTGKGYAFNAVAEEEGAFYKGTASIRSEQKVGGIDTFKIDFDYKNTAFSGFLNHTGDSIGSIQQNVRTELVGSKTEAVGQLPFVEKAIVALFGKVPAGDQNPVTKAAQSKPAQQMLNTTVPPSSPTSPDKSKGQ